MANREHDLVKYFRSQALPDFNVQQSPFIKISGQRYAVVGQTTLNSFLFSHFVVLDANGECAHEKTAATVYQYISMLQMTGLLERMQGLLDDPTNSPTSIGEDFQAKYGKDINEGLRRNERVRSLLQHLVEEKEKVSNVEVWEADRFQPFREAWDAFWDEYEPRMNVLFDFRDYVWEQDANVAVQETNLQHVYQEADIMYLLFSETIPADQPFITNADDLIQLAGELGRVPSYDTHTRFLTTFERFSMHFFKVAYRTFFWFLFPISLLYMVYGMLHGNYNLRPPFNVLVIGFVFFVAHSVDKHGRETKIMRRFKRQRKEQLGRHPLIAGKYSEAYANVKAKEQQKAESAYAFVAIQTIWGNLMIGIGIFTFIIGLGVLGADKETHDYGYIWMAIAGIFLVLRILLPFTGLAQIHFRLDPDGLKRGKKAKTFLRNLFEIRTNQRGSKFAIDIGLQQRQKFKIKPAYRQHTKEQLEIWADKHGIKFKDRLYF